MIKYQFLIEFWSRDAAIHSDDNWCIRLVEAAIFQDAVDKIISEYPDAKTFVNLNM